MVYPMFNNDGTCFAAAKRFFPSQFSIYEMRKIIIQTMFIHSNRLKRNLFCTKMLSLRMWLGVAGECAHPSMCLIHAFLHHVLYYAVQILIFFTQTLLLPFLYENVYVIIVVYICMCVLVSVCLCACKYTIVNAYLFIKTDYWRERFYGRALLRNS